MSWAIKKFYNAQNLVIKFFEGCFLMVSDAKEKAAKAKGLRYQLLNKWFKDCQLLLHK